MKAEIQKKIQMVDELSEVLIKYLSSIKKVSYEVFVNNLDAFDHDESCYKKEYVMVTFKGDAISVRDCSGDSFSSIVNEIGALLDGGYYDEVKTYLSYANDPKFTNISNTFRK